MEMRFKKWLGEINKHSKIKLYHSVISHNDIVHFLILLDYLKMFEQCNTKGRIFSSVLLCVSA